MFCLTFCGWAVFFFSFFFKNAGSLLCSIGIFLLLNIFFFNIYPPLTCGTVCNGAATLGAVVPSRTHRAVWLLRQRAIGPCRTQLRLAWPNYAEWPSWTRSACGSCAGWVGGVGTSCAVIPSLTESWGVGKARHVAMVPRQTVLTLRFSHESSAVVESSWRAGLRVLGLGRAEVTLGANVGITGAQAWWGGGVRSTPDDKRCLFVF